MYTSPSELPELRSLVKHVKHVKHVACSVLDHHLVWW